MLFNSIEFVAFFLPIVWLVFFLLGHFGWTRSALSWLVAASLFFYGWWNPSYLVLILVSILFNFAVGRWLGRAKKGQLKTILALGVVANIGTLGYFKYANFFVENINALASTELSLAPIVLPLAISFFTFQQVAYLVDSYQGKVSDCSFLEYCIFVTFFPQLIAGPIVHHKEVLPQFAKPELFRFKSENVADGLTLFFIGLFKKAVMADGLSVFATPIFSAAEQGSEISFFLAWTAALSYTFQLYFDFSGYSDMAIGIGRMFNVKLPENFYSPYKSQNIVEFWRRWHITLSCFLRDYLYIPLGGSRCGKTRRYINLMITMVIGGLWHGASWTFVAWGTLHGLYLVINHAWKHTIETIWPRSTSPTRSRLIAERVFGQSITFLAVIVAWVLFRAETFSGAVSILQGMFGQSGFVLPTQIANALPIINRYVETVGTMPLLAGGSILGVVELIGMLALSTFLISMPASQEMGPRLRWIALSLSLYFSIQSVFFSRAASEFLYFQF